MCRIIRRTPLQLPKKYEDVYKDLRFDTDADRQSGKAWASMTEKDKADARKVYGMATNIDDNVGRILDELKKQRLEDNTIVIFLTDNETSSSGAMRVFGD